MLTIVCMRLPIRNRFLPSFTFPTSVAFQVIRSRIRWIWQKIRTRQQRNPLNLIIEYASLLSSDDSPRCNWKPVKTLQTKFVTSIVHPEGTWLKFLHADVSTRSQPLWKASRLSARYLSWRHLERILPI